MTTNCRLSLHGAFITVWRRYMKNKQHIWWTIKLLNECTVCLFFKMCIFCCPWIKQSCDRVLHITLSFKFKTQMQHLLYFHWFIMKRVVCNSWACNVLMLVLSTVCVHFVPHHYFNAETCIFHQIVFILVCTMLNKAFYTGNLTHAKTVLFAFYKCFDACSEHILHAFCSKSLF